MIPIYVASCLRHAPRWRALRHEYRHRFTVLSHWIDIAPLKDADPEACREGWKRNLLEIRDCDFLILYAEPDDKLRGGLVEAGAALALYKTVVVVGHHPDYSTWRRHPGVLWSPTLEGAFELILSGAYSDAPSP